MIGYPPLPSLVQSLLSDALHLTNASLVIFRSGILVEFKTNLLQMRNPPIRLDGSLCQVGGEEGHHCHLQLGQVATIHFDAEPLSCQRGRLNDTVWFLSGKDCGNPYKRDGLFSVTFNAPYDDSGMLRIDEALSAIVSTKRMFQSAMRLPATPNAGSAYSMALSTSSWEG